MKNNTKKTLQIYWQQAWKYKFAVIFIVLGVTTQAVLNTVSPLYFKKFFDVLANSSIYSNVVGVLTGLLLMILLIELSRWFFSNLAQFLSSILQTKVTADLNNFCYQYLMKHSVGFFNDNFVGSLVKKVKWFARAFETVADRVTWDFLALVVNIIVILVVLFSRSPILSISLIIWMILFLVLNWFFVKYKLKYDILRSEEETKTTGFLADTVTNATTVKFFNGYKKEVKSFFKLTDQLRKLRKKSWNIAIYFEAVQGLMMTFLEIGIFYLAVGLWQRGILTIGDFVLIQAYLLNVFMRVWDFGRVIRSVYESLADAEEMTQILNTPHEIQDVVTAKDLEVVDGKIEFKDVTFYYHKTRKVLQLFNMEISAKQHLALIGPSVAGKTTVVKLLMRIYDLSAGHILIDGQDVARVTQESLWQNISLVPQDPILFHRSLMENIRYGKPKASDQEVIKAAKMAHCHEFISQLPDGYETYVGERGVKLSGGERQRVAIARAILRNAPILVLDEATSSLDSESELLIQDALQNLMAGKTVIVIAHRLSTIRKMDRIVVVDDGKIVEDDSHNNLVKNKKGLYYKLWQLQAGGFIG